MFSWNDYLSAFREQETRVEVGSEVMLAPPPKIEDWYTDSRQTVNQGWFVALEGENFDGHNFVQQLLTGGGCLGALCCLDYYMKASLELQKCLIGVPSPLEALQRMAKMVRQRHGQALKVVALTGSVGKTTTKEMIREILIEHYGQSRVLATEKNYNNDVGVAKLLLQRSSEHAASVVEMGARKPKDIERLVQLAEPNVAICLNAKDAHLGIFGSLANLQKTKLEILGPHSKASDCVVPGDDPVLVSAAQASGKRVWTFGLNEADRVRADHIYVDPVAQVQRFDLVVDGQTSQVLLHSLNQAFVTNACAAAAACSALGLPLQSIQAGLCKFSPLAGRFQVSERGALTLVDDCYNANAASMEAGLKSLKASFPQQNLALFLGTMAELGEESMEKHRLIGRLVGQTIKPRLLVTVGEEGGWIADEAARSGLEQTQIRRVQTNVEAKRVFSELSSEVEVAYFKASRSVELEVVFAS